VRSIYSGCGPNVKLWHAQKKAEVTERVRIELFARFLLLRIMLSDNAQLTPAQFRDYQLNSGAKVIAELITLLLDVTPVLLSSIKLW
jgi:hypothetical protein